MTNTLENSVENSMAKNRSLVERIGQYIPLYRGYKQKNLRRDEDRAVRETVARVLAGSKTDLANAARATVGDLNAMRDMERVRSKVDHYYADVKKAVNGYSAFHNSVKILESELDAVVTWDAKLIDDAHTLKEETERLRSVADSDGDIKAPLRDIEATVDALFDAYRERENVMRGFIERENDGSSSEKE